MATRRSTSSSRSSGGTQRYDRGTNGGRQDDMHGENRGGLRGLAKGIHVSAEMPDPRVARITIDIDWQNLVARVARTVRRKVKQRASGAGHTRRTSSRRRSSRA
jgi:hypothetical protein